MRRANLAAMIADIIPPQIIGHNDDDIRLIGGLGLACDRADADAHAHSHGHMQNHMQNRSHHCEPPIIALTHFFVPSVYAFLQNRIMRTLHQ
jgi:hypothetical protein